jgi:ATP-dependent Clp protease protease subunit|tara:strand:+ start:561 stop:1214 length:654 start_codon:yes stop_codon:yes gene_type:complete
MRNEFEKYAKSEFGLTTQDMYDVKSSMTPMVIEEREMRAVSMSVFDRLMMERIIWCAGPVNDRMSTIVQAQLMFLDSIGSEDITMHIDSPGGSVKSGLSIVDVMDYIKCDIRTINTGMAASMGSVLLGAGTKGKRSSLRFSKVMLHQSSGGADGNIQDARISMVEWEKTNKILFELLGDYCGKTANVVMKDSARDLWLSSDEALDYGIIDEIITKKN